MSERTIDGFFYGLFMDADVLATHNIPQRNPRRAYVVNFGLLLGDRATLWPEEGTRAYGMIYSMAHAEIEKLYAGPGLEEYKPEALSAVTLDGTTSTCCLCYNLAVKPAKEIVNQEYATRLQLALTKLGFPRQYIKTLG